MAGCSGKKNPEVEALKTGVDLSQLEERDEDGLPANSKLPRFPEPKKTPMRHLIPILFLATLAESAYQDWWAKKVAGDRTR